MGQGYSLTTLSAASASIDVPELADLVHEKTLASGRFLKSVRARNQQGFVFVKAVVKPYAGFDVSSYAQQLLHERDVLASIPNALGYQRVIEVANGGFLVRQFINNSAYDRLSTRPFLEEIEKKWLAFQILSAVRDCHAQNLHHGDIKTENVLVTSWNWLYLTDFSSAFKPASLPEDNPADFSFYFDTSGRRTCYLAPERFTRAIESPSSGELNWAMDMFGIGCVIAELFLEGSIFSLSQIFKYKSGEYDPGHHLRAIENADVREMIQNMIELEPEKRYSAEQHLAFYRGKIFPDYFSSFLHQYLQDLTEPSSGKRSVSLEIASQADSDEKIDRLYADFDKISFFLGYSRDPDASGISLRRPSSLTPASISKRKLKQPEADSSLYDGTLLFLTIVVSSVRNTSKAASRLKACDLMLAFAARLPDEAKLDRVLPYIADLLNDGSDPVRVAALKATTTLLDSIKVVTPMNADIFPVYLFPRLRSFVSGVQREASVLLRASYASCLATLALSSSRILDMTQAIRVDGRLQPYVEASSGQEITSSTLYDRARDELVQHFEDAIKALITDPDASVRRALLSSVSGLCVFLGSSRASDVILSHLNTYANDQDWILKCSFYESLVGVAAYVGSSSLEKFLLPVMVQSLADPENFVVERVFRSLARMASLGLFQRATTWELTSIAVRFLVHPSLWIRESAAHLITSSSSFISIADKHCIVIPLLRPFLRSTMMEVSEDGVLDALKAPLPRAVFENAVQWARRHPESAFWVAASRDSTFTLQEPDKTLSPMVISKKTPTQISAWQRRENIKQLDTLKTLGMTPEDEVKLVALREYIFRVGQRPSSSHLPNHSQQLNGIVPLTQIDVTPQNVFFDTDNPVRNVQILNDQQTPATRPERDSRTIADALMEASATFSERPNQQRSATDQGPRPVPGTATVPQRLTAPREFIVRSSSDMATNTSPLVLSEASPSSNPETASIHRQSSFGPQNRGSVINLMSRQSTLRADAETSTTSEVAFAKLNGPLQSRKSSVLSPLALAAENTKSAQIPQMRYTPNHDYGGNDSNVLRLLENHFKENFAIDQFNFGQPRPLTDYAASIRRPNDAVPSMDTSNSEARKLSDDPWRPSGHLLTMFSEHTAAITRVVAAPDHIFFVTASDDGTCKVWDTVRLEKNITPRSRHTIKHGAGVKVKSICFVDNTHTFISSGSDGSIRAVRIEYRGNDSGDGSKFSKPTLVRDWQIQYAASNQDATRPEVDSEAPEHAVWLYHYRTSTSQSILLAATTHHRILAIDMKTMDVLYTLDNPVHHGSITTFVVDKKHDWLLLGTSHGILDLWDLRFRLRLRSMGVQTSARIDRILTRPGKGHGKWVLVSAGGEISTWDIEKCACREVFRPSSFAESLLESSKPYDVWYPDDEPSEKVLERFAKQLATNSGIIEPIMRPESPTTPSTHPSRSSQNATVTIPPMTTFPILALTTYTDHTTNHANPQSAPDKSSFLLTGTLSRTLTLWDLTSPVHGSKIISGPQILSSEQNMLDGKIRARYVLEHPLTVHRGGLVGVVQELVPNAAGEYEPDSTPQRAKHNTNLPPESGRRTPKGKEKDRATPTRTQSGISTATTPSTSTPTATSSSATPSTPTPKPPRNALIAAQPRSLLRTHMHGITDAIVLRKPYGCVVSVDQGGCVFVFQ